MRLFILFFFLVLLAAFILTLSCGKKEQPKVTAPTSAKTSEPAVKPVEPVPALATKQEGEEPQPAGQEVEPQGEEPAQLPADEEKMPGQLAPTKDTSGLLIDVNDKSQNISYWRDAQKGDWTRFLNISGIIGMYNVIDRQGNKITSEFRLFDKDGKEVDMDEKGKMIPKPLDAKPEIDVVDLLQNDEDVRGPLRNNPFLVRQVADWKVFKSDKIIHCERRFEQKGGWTNEHLYSRDVRAGGMVFLRSRGQTIKVLLDWGDKDNPPKWGIWTDDELKKWKFRWDRYWHEEFVENEDPDEPEPPENAEDPPSEAIVSLMSKVATAFAQKIAAPIEKNADLTGVREEVENLLPLLKELEQLHKKERFGYGVVQAHALVNVALSMKDSISSGDPAIIKDSLARARSAYERLRIATKSDAKW
jgi:hypothetical protein